MDTKSKTMDGERASCGEDEVFTCRSHLQPEPDAARASVFSCLNCRRRVQPPRHEAHSVTASGRGCGGLLLPLQNAVECRVHDWAESMPRKPTVRREGTCTWTTCLASPCGSSHAIHWDNVVEWRIGGVSGELLLAWP